MKGLDIVALLNIDLIFNEHFLRLTRQTQWRLT